MHNNKISVFAKVKYYIVSPLCKIWLVFLIFMVVLFFSGFTDGITRRMVRAASGASTCVEFVGSEPTYDDSQFIPVPISKGKNTHQNSNALLFEKKQGRYHCNICTCILKLALTI